MRSYYKEAVVYRNALKLTFDVMTLLNLLYMFKQKNNVFGEKSIQVFCGL